MKWYLAITVLLFIVSAEGSLFNYVGYHDDPFHFGTDYRPKYHDLQNNLKTIIGISPESPRFLLAMISGRISVPVARAMLSRYVSQHGFDGNLLSAIRGLRNREDLILNLLMLHQTTSTLESTIMDGLKKEQDDRIYTFMVDSLCNCSLYYADERDGTMKGLWPDMINAGLLSRQFEGCPVGNTSGIARAFALGERVLDYNGPARFFVRTGNPGNFNPNALEGKRIGVIKGWYSNRQCLIESGKEGTEILASEQIRVFENREGFLASIKKNQIDAAFILVWPIQGVDDEDAEMLGGTPAWLEPIGDIFSCSDGVFMGARKDSTMLKWFDATLRKMKENGKFAKVCMDAQIKHGDKGRIDCVL
ncbi:uncharacterized protein [Ptychodera flava]|uniref:uncharacterized protein isoform X2 n=1 Tax=Ptychodera flava TaxID=63121 RepID=UPI00396A1E50